MSSTANIKNKYLKLLDKFKRNSIQTVENEHTQALSLLTQAFEEERDYIHMPVLGERASRDVLDSAFTLIQNNHVAVEGALAALVEDVNKLEADMKLDDELLDALLSALRAEITVRALSTTGQEQYEKQITESFDHPLTLSPDTTTDKTFAATEVEWEPTDPTSLTWLGDLESSPTNPIQQPLGVLLTGSPITVQTVAWNLSADISDALLAALESALASIIEVQPLKASDFFIVSGLGTDSPPLVSPNGSGVLKIKLDVPELMSHVKITTEPADIIDYVLVINHQGVPTMYEMIETDLFIRPTAVKELQFHVTGGSASISLDTFFTAIINYAEVLGGSPHVSGYFIDMVSENFLGKPNMLLSKRIKAENEAANEAAREAANKAAIQSAKDQSPSIQSDKARDLLSVTSQTSTELKIDPSKASSLKTTELGRDKASGIPPGIGAEGQDIKGGKKFGRQRDLELEFTPTSKPDSVETAQISSSKGTATVSSPRDILIQEPKSPTPYSARSTTTPPGQSNRGEQDIVTTQNVPSGTQPPNANPRNNTSAEKGFSR